MGTLFNASFLAPCGPMKWRWVFAHNRVPSHQFPPSSVYMIDCGFSLLNHSWHSPSFGTNLTRRSLSCLDSSCSSSPSTGWRAIALSGYVCAHGLTWRFSRIIHYVSLDGPATLSWTTLVVPFQNDHPIYRLMANRLPHVHVRD